MTLEDLRFEVRSHLYSRPTASEQAAQICNHLRRRGHEVTADAVTAALVFLEGLTPAQVQRRHGSLGGGVPFWQITSAGILAHERNE